MKAHPDQFAEMRDQLFTTELPRCACCHKKKNDVGEYTDGAGREFCSDCGANCTSSCWERKRKALVEAGVVKA